MASISWICNSTWIWLFAYVRWKTSSYIGQVRFHKCSNPLFSQTAYRNVDKRPKTSNLFDKFSGLQTPNGLFWEPETRRLFVSLTNAEVRKHSFLLFLVIFQTVKVYNVRQDMTLTELTQISLMTSPDQLYFQKSTGELWLTAHPVTYQLLSLAFSDFQSQSASHVLRVRFQVWSAN